MEYGEPEIGATHLLLCREVKWDGSDPDTPYSLRGVMHSITPPTEYPVVVDQLHVYAAFYGESEELDVWVDLVRFVFDDDGDIVDEFDEATFGPFSLTLAPNRFVQGRWYVLLTVPFPIPGVYEFRLRIGGLEGVLISTRLQLEN